MNLSEPVKWQSPEAFADLFQPSRYKIFYGGRGAAKSWNVARSLLILGWQNTIRVLCCREFQSSIAESVHRLLSDQIKALGLEAFYTIEKARIFARNGTEFGFEGLRHNVTRIKSWEGANYAWVEEAQTVSKSSWETLIPTIRRDGSEIWVTFNPELDTDETYKRFVLTPPPSAIVKKVSYRDNPWFPEVLKQEMETLKARDEDAYLTIWEGNCRVTLDGAIYAKEIRAATTEGRIRRVPYVDDVPVNTFWDLGHADCTSIWFGQRVGFEYHLIDFYQNRLEKLPHYLKVLQDRGYVYGTHYLPHDADHEMLAAISISKQMKATGLRVVTNERVKDKPQAFNAVRTIFPHCYFDESKCADGLQSLRRYRYEVDEQGQYARQPLHDENSHAADAFHAFAQSVDRGPMATRTPQVEIVTSYDRAAQEVSWMGT